MSKGRCNRLISIILVSATLKRGRERADPSPYDYSKQAGTGGDWDKKSRVSNVSLLYGKYASPRDAGNFAAGIVAQKSGFEPIVQFGFGAYNMTGNNKIVTGIITYFQYLFYTTPSWVIGAMPGYLISNYGEDELSQRSIDLGKQYINSQK